VFRRRRSADVGRNWPEDLADDEFDDEPDGEPAGPGDPEAAGSGPVPGGFRPEEVPAGVEGPWDGEHPYPQGMRIDLGSLQVPMGPEHEIELAMADQNVAWVNVRHGQSEMQLQAFAAPRQGALWDDVRAEIVTEVAAAGGTSEETEGSFGTELMAQVPVEPGQPASGLRLVRFIGADGPRWFLRGLLTGPAAVGGEPAGLLEEVFRDIVVIRGEHPVPPRDLLELRLPPETRKALEEQAEAEAENNRFRGDLNPFERGPEFTETR
jgi:hypothetical protein